MLVSNSPGFIIPALFLSCGLFCFYLTVRSARLLQNVFSTWKFRRLCLEEAQIRERCSMKSVLKRIFPVYAGLNYNSVQYEVPPVGHCFQFLTYILMVCGGNFLVALLAEDLALGVAVIVGLLCTVISILVSATMQDSFVRSMNRAAKREFEIKVADNSTILDCRGKESVETEIWTTFVVVITISCMGMILGAVFCMYLSVVARDDLILTSFVSCCVSWALDLPFRLLVAWVLKKFNLVQSYEEEFCGLAVEIRTCDIAWLRVKENYEEERNDSFPNQDLSIPFDCSRNFSPKVNKGKTMHSCEIMVPRMSPIESEPEQEFSEKPPSDRSYDTIASHNANSEDENFQDKIIFGYLPRARSPIKSKFSSPVKYSSPVKKKENKKPALLYLHEVSMDNEPNAEMSRDYFTSDQEGGMVKSSWNQFIEQNFEEDKESFDDMEYGQSSERKGMKRVILGNGLLFNDIAEKQQNEKIEKISLEKQFDLQEISLRKENSFEESELNQNIENQTKSQKFLKPETKPNYENPVISKDLQQVITSDIVQSNLSSKRKEGQNSFIESFDKSDHFPINEDYKADHEGDGEQYIEHSPKKLSISRKVPQDSLQNPDSENFPQVPDSSLLSILQKIPKPKKNSTNLPKQPKQPPPENKIGKTLISLHRKLISFEEDMEVHPVQAQLISHLNISGKSSIDPAVPGASHFPQISKITEKDEVTSSQVSKREDPLNPEQCLKPLSSEGKFLTFTSSDKARNAGLGLINPVPYEDLNENVPDPSLIPTKNQNSQSSDSNSISNSSLSSYSSSSSSSSSPDPVLSKKSVIKVSSRKKMQVLTSNGESEDNYHDTGKKYISKSGDEIKAVKPPCRASRPSRPLNPSGLSTVSGPGKPSNHSVLSRPSKSNESRCDREALSSAELKHRAKLENYFISKAQNSKDLVKDKKVFDKKNRKEILKHIEKLLQVKENEHDDIEIARLKAMLASRQSFKRKQMETPKDTPYNQKIQTILSDGSTPVEEFRLDPQAVKKREERLKRISSIYSAKRTKSGRRKKTALSPSKSENLMKGNLPLV